MIHPSAGGIEIDVRVIPRAGKSGVAGERDGRVLVRLSAAALNRRDLWITKGKYGGIKLPCVLGADGAGVVLRGYF
mgnify:CR=1 FL=1